MVVMSNLACLFVLAFGANSLSFRVFLQIFDGGSVRFLALRASTLDTCF
jgi:hypothetical protein